MAVAVKITGLQLHRAQAAPSEAVLSRSFLDFRLGETGDRVGHWREKAPATVTQRGVTHFSDVCLVAGGEGPSACDVMLKSVRDGGFVTQHLGQGTLLSKQLVKGSGLLEVELCTEAGYGDVVGSLQMQLTHKGRACFLVPPCKVADDFDWSSSWDEEEDEEGSSEDVEESPASYEWIALDPVPLDHNDTWPSLRPRVAWEGFRPPSAEEVLETERLKQQFRPFKHETLMLLARCKLALEASGQAVPGGALPALPQSGWQGVAGDDRTSWTEYLHEVQDKLRDLGVSEDVLRLTELPSPWGDDASRLGSGNDPLAIAHSLSLAGLHQDVDPLYDYVYGRSIAEALGDLPEHWREEERHWRRMLREGGSDNPASVPGVGDGLL